MTPLLAIGLDFPLWYRFHPSDGWQPIKVCEAVAVREIRPVALVNPGFEEGMKRWVDEGYAAKVEAFRLKHLELIREKLIRERLRSKQ